jgi:signal peptidase II
LKRPLFIILFILLCDQTLKFWVKTHMYLGQEIHVLDNWFILHFTENNGMAFGLQLAGESGKLFLSIVRLLAILALGYYLVHLVRKKTQKGLIICISLIFAGATGNLIDSALYGLLFSQSNFFHPAVFLPHSDGYSSFLLGKVVDMLYFPIVQWHWPAWVPVIGTREFTFFRPIFNIADSSITVGVLALIIFQKRLFRKKVTTPETTITNESN